MTTHADQQLGQLGRAGARPASTAVVALTDTECWARLRTQDLGRVAVDMEGQPLVFPVNYAAGVETIVFRTSPGTMLERARGSRACFEIDGYERAAREGWSVMAIGNLEDITDASDPDNQRLRGMPVQPLAPGIKPRWIAMRVAHISGRQFTAGWFVPGNWLG